MSAKEDLLMTLLGCGSMDLEMLDDVRYDFDEIVDQLDGEPIQDVGFNGLMRAVVDVGIIHIRDALQGRLDELNAADDEDLGADEREELEALRQLDPDDDIRSFHNCLDTRVWFETNGDIYRQYLSETLDEFADNTGFEIG